MSCVHQVQPMHQFLEDLLDCDEFPDGSGQSNIFCMEGAECSFCLKLAFPDDVAGAEEHDVSCS